MEPLSSAAAPARPFWQRWANLLAFAALIGCGALLAWVGWHVWRHVVAEGRDRQAVNLSAYVLGLAAALFVPLVWMFFASVLNVLAGRPRGRWVALGWGLLTLGSAGPLVWHYPSRRRACGYWTLAWDSRRRSWWRVCCRAPSVWGLGSG